MPAVEPSRMLEKGLDREGTLAMEESTQGLEDMKDAADEGSALKDDMPVSPSSQK